MDQLVGKETAVLAKEIGFYEPCYYLSSTDSDKILANKVFNNESFLSVKDMMIELSDLGKEDILIPTQTQLSKWIREKYKLYVYVYCNGYGWTWEIMNIGRMSVSLEFNGPTYDLVLDNYERLMEAGLKMACEIIKKRNNHDSKSV